MKGLILLFSFYCFIPPGNILAQKKDQPLTKSLDSLLSARFQPNTPGCALLVAKKGQVVYNKAFGSADLELNVPLKPEMVFKIASVTKQFTAVAILQLMEQDKLSLQDSVQQYIKDFPSKGYKITIENLLTHTSGIRDYMQIDYPEPYMERRDYSPKQLIDSFKNFPLEFEPGVKFNYSNSGYFLLGYIIEKISGKRFQAYVEENLLRPLGLNHTYFDSSNIIIRNRVKGYDKEDNNFRNADYWSMTIAYSAGGLLSTTEDLFKWYTGLSSYKILKKETLEKVFIPFHLKDGTTTGYGYGWFIREANGIRSIRHDGGFSGFHSNEIYFPSEDIFIAVVFNCGCAPKDELSEIISGLALGKSMQKDLSVDENILDTYTGTYALQPDGQRTIIISKEKDHLVGTVPGEGVYPLLFESDTKFEFKNIAGAKCEFIKENGKVNKFIVSQNGNYEWRKTQ
jgi:CubicO group peptidase (beta-lactamase class C family)